MVVSATIYRTFLRLVRFSMVGFLNTLASYAVFALFIRMGCHYTIATLAAYTVGMLMGFKLHGAYVFDHPGDHRFLRFTLISLALFACSLGIQALARTIVNDYLAGAIAAAITIPVSFLLNRAFVFHAPAPPDQDR
ncbi:GtrA family protein [Massilia sp. TSP1-1-2]|uniref:GtrA family protein n=1 Tax=unclassified Massilia TaxID=2609279 RepID=UPI003CEA0004